MSKTIDQFMWGFQHHFRVRVELAIQQVLDKLGMVSTGTKVLLVGISTEDNARHPICVEPETGPLFSEHLALVSSRAEELYQSDPESQMRYSHPTAHVQQHHALFLKARADAIIEAIEKSGSLSGRTCFVSQSSPINGYDVHTCIGVPTDVIRALPAFKESTVDRYHAGRSLQHEVIQECLYRADKALFLPDPGTELRILGRPEDIIASATERFMEGITWRTAREPSDLFSALNAVASQTYERNAARGKLNITSRENLEKWLTVKFKDPVRIRESRIMRKLLQLSDDDMSVLADPARAYGLGPCKTAPDIIEITITGHGKWEASVNGDKFVRVDDGNATIPNRPIELEKLEDVADRIIGDTNTKRIWDIIQSAQESGHGTTIVVSKDPEAESARLGSEGMTIEPDYLEPAEIVRLASIDGAVMVGPDGRCHAFGVILDGVSNERGDRARGARFNSSIRYQNMETAGSMIVVISDDGTVDLLPKLMPRVHREDVAEIVDDFCRFCDSKHVNGEEFGRLYERVELFRFYLNDEQCRIVNEKYDQEMDRRLATGGARITGRDFKPNPRMNESYFWDSQSGFAQ